jgi:beta-lactamase class D
MEIQRINTGVCHWRATHGQPAMFVGWIQNGERKYFFSSIRSSIEKVENQLKKITE